jgi:DNA-directed RNA polymerase beta' subunit
LIFKTISNQLSKVVGVSSKKMEDVIYYRSYLVLNNGESNVLKKREILSKRMDSQLICKILDEIIKKFKIEEKKSIVEEAENMKKALLNYGETKSELETIFLEDYLDFISKHLKMKIGIGSEIFRDLLNEVDLEKELEIAKAKEQNPKIRFLKALIDNNIKLE